MKVKFLFAVSITAGLFFCLVWVFSGLFVFADKAYGSCGGNQSPVAILEANPEYLAADNSTSLDGSDSYDSDGTIVKYEWDFTNDSTYDYNETSGSAGDGSFDGITTHTYDTPGTYTVKLRVTDDDYATNTDTCTVYVHGTYYVDDVNGDDDNNGLTLSTAFKTIQKAADTVIAGDIIDIRAGTYTETVRPVNSGSTGNYITYRAYGTDDVNIVPSMYGLGIWLRNDRNLNYLKFENLTLKDANSTAFFADASDEPKSNIIVDGLTVEDCKRGIYFYDGVTDSEIKNCELSGCYVGIDVFWDCEDILIDDNYVHDANDWGSSYGINIRAGGYVAEVNEVFVTDVNRWCEDITITNNETEDSLHSGIVVGYAKNVLIQNNHCHHNDGSGIIIENYDTNDVGYNIVIEDNLCEYNSQNPGYECGIWVDDSKDVLVQDNIMRYNEIGTNITGSDQVIVRRNLIYKNEHDTLESGAGIRVNLGQRGQGKDNIIVHNTCHRNGGDNGRWAQIVLGIWDDPVSDDIIFKNNISSESMAAKCNFDLSVKGNHNSNFNNFYPADSNLTVCWQPVLGPPTLKPEKTWSEYLTLSGCDANSITSDPCFVDANTVSDPNLYLTSNSNCINAGGYLTTTTNSGTNATSVTVADSAYFCDGYGLIDGDSIKVGSNSLVEITDVNYSTNTITVDQGITWSSGDNVSYPYNGSKPDMGAYEYDPNS